MLAVRQLARQSRCPSKFVFRPLIQIRKPYSQQNGPHKEYFQDPAQFPVDKVGVDPRPPPPTPVFTTTPALLSRQDASQNKPKKIGLVRRFFRGALLTLVFIFIGWSAGRGVLTWEYTLPPFEPGSEEYTELEAEIFETLDSSSLVTSLREDGWIEDAEETEQDHIKKHADGCAHFVDCTLSGIQGITYKIFRLPGQNCTIVPLFFGFGVEGWPDVVHGGTISTILTEAYAHHMSNLADGELKIVPEHTRSTFNFLRPVRPGEVYAVILTTPFLYNADIQRNENKEVTNAVTIHSQTMAHFASLPAAPAVVVHNAQDMPADLVQQMSRHPTSLSNPPASSNHVNKQQKPDSAEADQSSVTARVRGALEISFGTSPKAEPAVLLATAQFDGMLVGRDVGEETLAEMNGSEAKAQEVHMAELKRLNDWFQTQNASKATARKTIAAGGSQVR